MAQEIRPVGEKRPRATNSQPRAAGGVSSAYPPAVRLTLAWEDASSSLPTKENDVFDDDDDASVAAMHAMKRLKVGDDNQHETDEGLEDHAMGGVEQEHGDCSEDERVSLASASSSVESTPPPTQNHREVRAHLSLDDLPLTPKLNNCTHHKTAAAAINRLFLPDALLPPPPPAAAAGFPPHDNHNDNLPQPGMNAYLGRLHQERRQSNSHQSYAHLPHPSLPSTTLSYRMDALCLESTSSPSSSANHHYHPLLLPMLSPSLQPTQPPPRRKSFQIQLHTDSKLE